MPAKEKISRASWIMMESVKDSVTTIIAQATKEGKLPLNQSQSMMIQTLLIQSIEAGYHRAYNAYMREVAAALDQD